MKRSSSGSYLDVLFLAALFSVLLGVGLLPYTTKHLLGFTAYWPFTIICAGVVLLYLVFQRKASAYFLFGGFFLLFNGIFLLVNQILKVPFRIWWPLLIISAGLSGLLSSFKHIPTYSRTYFIPSIFLFLLGVVFSGFSFKVFTITLSEFIRIWWPSLIISGGVFLFVVFILQQRKRTKDAANPNSHSSWAVPKKYAQKNKE